MKPLQKQFQGKGEVKGYLFNQIRQTDRAYVYEVSFGNSKHYEVFKKVVNKRFSCISYPTSKAFGIWSWIKMSLEKAEEKLDDLNS